MSRRDVKAKKCSISRTKAIAEMEKWKNGKQARNQQSFPALKHIDCRRNLNGIPYEGKRQSSAADTRKK